MGRKPFVRLLKAAAIADPLTNPGERIMDSSMVDAASGRSASRRRFRGCVAFAVHAVACVALLFAGPLSPANAQSTWNATSGTGDWNTSGNWLGGVPSGTAGVAVFSGTGLTLSATGSLPNPPAYQPFGQLRFSNPGTTTIAVNRFSLYSGTAILLDENSGNVFINNTSNIGAERNVNVGSNQIWRNDSTTGTLSVQETNGTVFLRNSSDIPGKISYTLTLAGRGAFTLGSVTSETTTEGTAAAVIFDGTGLLTLSRLGIQNTTAFTLNNSGTVRNAATSFGSGLITINGGAIEQVGAGTANSPFLMNNSFSLLSGTLVQNGDNNARAFSTGTSAVRFTVNNGALFETIRANFTGTTQFTKAGAGTLVLTRVFGTGFSGGFRMEEGLLVLQNDTGNNAGGTPLGTGTFTIAGGTISAGRGQTASLTMPSRFEGNFSVGGAAGFSLGSGTVTLATTPTINVQDPGVTFTIGGTVVGGFGLTKDGPGLLTLSSANTFSGTTRVNSGTISLGNALGLQNSGLDTDGSGRIVYNAARTSITLGGLAGSSNLSTVIASGFSSGTSLTLNPQSGMTYSYSGVIANFGSNMTLTKTGPGVQELTGLNTFSGQTTIAEGTLSVDQILNSGANSPLGTNGTVNLGGASTSGILRYTGSSNETTTRVFNMGNGGGGFENNGSGSLVISSAVSGGSGSRVFRLMGTNTGSNSIAAINGSDVSVQKSGPGTWWLTGASTYSGTLRVLDGTVIVGSVGSTGSSSFGSSTDTSSLPRIGDSSATSGTAALLTTGTIVRGFYVESGGGSQVVALGGFGAGLSRFDSVPVRLGRDVTLQASAGGTVSFANSWRTFADGFNPGPAVRFTIGSEGNAGTVVLESFLPPAATGVDVRRGTLRLDYNDPVKNVGPITYTAPVTVGDAGASATLLISSSNQPLSNLSFTGNGSTVSSTGPGRLRLFNSGSTATVGVSGTGHQISAPVFLDDASTFNVASSARLAVSGLIANGTNGARNLTKTGLGTLELSGANNTYTGNTLIESGTLVIGATGAISGSSAITIGSAGSRGFLQIGHNLSISSLTFTGQGGDVVDPSLGTATFSSTTGTAVITVLGGTNDFHANATLLSPTVVNVADGALFTFHNNLAGGASLTKSGSGIMQLVGDNESLSGNLFITGGQVNIGAGMSQIGTGTTTLSNGAILNLNGQSFTNFIDSSGGFIINNGGTSTTTITGPTVVSSTASLLGTYAITSTGSARFEGVLGNGSSLVTVQVGSGSGSGARAVFANAVSGSGNVTVWGASTFDSTVSGYVTSHGSSTFNGNLLAGGEVGVRSGGSAVFSGTAASGSIVDVNAGGAAEFRSTVAGIATVTGSALFTSAAGLTGSLTTGSGGVATLDNVLGSAITGQIHNDGTLNIVRSTGSETISAAIDGTGGLVKQGGGQITLTGENTYSGLTTVSAGTLAIGTGGTAGSIAGNIANNAAVIFNRSDAVTYAGIISGNGSLTKQGEGKLTLTGNNNALAGLTTVEQGSLAVNGFLGSGGLSVLTGATLMGSGTIGGDATIAGIHSPGNSPDIQTFTGNLTYMGGTSQVIWELLANTADPASRGGSYDGINVTGTLNFAGLTTLKLDFGGFRTGSVSWENAFWDSPQTWLLYSVSGTTTGSSYFQLASNPGSWFDSTGQAFSDSTRSTNTFSVVQSGNNIILQYVPEPAAVTLALIGIAASAYAAVRRRRS